MLEQLQLMGLSLIEDGARVFTVNYSIMSLGLIFLSVFIGVLGATALLTSSAKLQRRLNASESGSASASRIDKRGAMENKLAAWGVGIIEGASKRMGKQTREPNSQLSERLMQAGFMRPNAVALYYAWRVFLAVVFPLVFLLMFPLFSHKTDVATLLWFGMLLAFVGLFLPTIVVLQRISGRQLQAREGFPDALDMLLVCVEAGLSLDAAINRVGHVIGDAYPLLGQQFELTALELRGGKSRQDALRNFSRRVGTPEVAALVTLLIQSDLLGSSVAQTLRVHADDMRVKRMLNAEEKAHKLPVKLSVPLIFLILPALLIVILSPSVIDIIRDLFPLLMNSDYSVIQGQ